MCCKKIIRNPQVATLHFIKSKQAQFIIEKKQIRNGIAAANEEKTMQELEDDEMKIVKNRIEFIKELSTQTNLKHMLIGTRGGCSLFRALENNGFLTKLVLSKARLTDEAIEAFIIAFPTMKSLQHVDLSQNAITDKGAKAIANVIEECGKKMLTLGATEVDDNGEEVEVEETMMDNLEILNVSYCRIQRHGLEALIKSSRLLQPHARLYISGNFISSVDDRDAIKFLIEKMAPRKKNFGEEFIHRDSGHHDVNDTIATAGTADDEAMADQNVNRSKAKESTDTGEYMDRELVSNEETILRPSRRTTRRSSKKEKLALEKPKKPLVGDKIVYGDRDLALPHVCSGKSFLLFVLS